MMWCTSAISTKHVYSRIVSYYRRCKYVLCATGEHRVIVYLCMLLLLYLEYVAADVGLLLAQVLFVLGVEQGQR